MDFFSSQDAARKSTKLLIVYFLLAVGGIIVAVWGTIVAFVAYGATGDVSSVQNLNTNGAIGGIYSLEGFLTVAGIVLLIIGLGTLYKIFKLRGGGKSVATSLGGHLITPDTTDFYEKRLLNVVEEISLASGVPVPAVYLLGEEDAINAFAAGYSPDDAVLGVTRGTMTRLKRNELQGVIAHEFSHVLNGDMRLNIRLMGIVHGILIIALIGRAMLRSGTPGYRRRGKKSGGGSALLGLAFLAIGYVGVFFGKLIKSAVSRQREYLADASAVQFTRDPEGVSGALKRIGGFTKGSKIKSSNAAEASHFYFADGISRSFLSLLDTHPPLDDRIRRIDPSFQGEFLPANELTPEDVEIDESMRARVSGFASGAGAGQAASTAQSEIHVSKASVIDSIGSPNASHLEYAHKLLASIPEDVREASRQKYGAQAVIFCLLLDPKKEEQDKQLDELTKTADQSVVQEVLKLLPAITGIDARVRLPLVDICTGSLRLLSKEEFSSFTSQMDMLIKSDGKINLFEYTLGKLIERHVKPHFEEVNQHRIKFRSIEDVLEEAVLIIAVLARVSSENEAECKEAFAKALEKIPQANGVACIELTANALATLSKSLDKVAHAAGHVRKQVLEACIACVIVDDHVTIAEAELLRAISDGLGCPMPPILPS